MKRSRLYPALAWASAFALALILHSLVAAGPAHGAAGGETSPPPWLNASWAAMLALAAAAAAVAFALRSRTGRADTSRALADSLLQQSHGAIIGTDLAGAIRFWNPGAERLFGHTREQALGMNILSLFPGDCREQAIEVLRAGERAGLHEFESKALHRSRHSFDIQLAVWRHGERADSPGLTWFGMDISARKQLERTIGQVLDAGYGRSAAEFLHFLTEQLAAKLNTAYAFVAEFDDDGQTARMLSFWNRDRFQEPFAYRLADTPCGELRDRDLVCYADRAAQRFPQDPFLQDHHIHAYLAIALFDARGVRLGHMGVMHDRNLTEVETCATVLRLFSSRAATELQRVRADHAVAHRVAMEELLAALSSSFVGVEPAEFEPQVDEALGRLGRFAGVERCHLYRYADDRCRARLTHLWSAPGTATPPDSHREIRDTAFPWHAGELQARGFVSVPDIDQLPPQAAAERAELQRGGIRSLLNVGMYGGGQLIGFLGFESLQRAIRWPPEDLRLLRVAGEVLASAAERLQREQTLRTLSSALDQTADAVLITAHDGTIEYVNPAFSQISGFSAREALGRQPSLLRSDAHDAAFFRELWHTILGGEVYRGTLVNRRKDGSLYHEEKTITPLKNHRGVITHFVSTGRDISERVQVQERLMHLAHHDALTDLPNRNLFMDRAQQAIARARRNGTQLAVLFLDLDGFKEINDDLGHDAGDALLRLVADRLRAGVRQGDTVSRLGGDEFTILIEDVAGPDDAASVAKKLGRNLAQPFSVVGAVRRVSASVGISLYPDDGQAPETLLTKADKAMFAAKRRAPPGSFCFARDA